MKSIHITLCSFLIIGLTVTGCGSDNPASTDRIGSAPENVTDVDGNVYDVVQIGDQWWMAENLRVTRYRNGDPIPNGLNDEEWSNTQIGAYAIYDHDRVDGIESEEEMEEAYGKLYNWHAATDPRGLCPAGWQVPTEEQAFTIRISLTGAVGKMLRSTRTEPDPHPRWNVPNPATNETGFSMLPGGRKNYTGGYAWLGEYGLFWTITEYAHNVNAAEYRSLFHSSDDGYGGAWGSKTTVNRSAA